MYTHARQFPHLSGLSDDEIRAIAGRAFVRHPYYARLRRVRNRLLIVAIGVTVAAWVYWSGERRIGELMMTVGTGMMAAGGAAFVFVLVWNLIWVNTVLYRLTDEEVSRK